MSYIVIYLAQAAFWAAALAGWVYYRDRLVLVIFEHVVAKIFRSDFVDAALYLHRVVGCVLLYMAADNVFAAVTWHSLNKIAAGVSGG